MSKRSETLLYIYLLLFIICLAVRKSIGTLRISTFMGVQMSVYGCTNVSIWVYKCQYMGVQMSVYGCTNVSIWVYKCQYMGV